MTWAHAGDCWGEDQIKAWREEVRSFCIALRSLGVDVEADVFHAHQPGIDWHHFGPGHIADRDFTIIAATVAWKARWEGRNDAHVGAGAAAEANVLHGIFSRDQHEFRSKVVIVELPSAVGTGAVPDGLRGTPRFAIPRISLEGLEDLVRLLTGQPRDPLPPLGEIPVLPPNARDGGPLKPKGDGPLRVRIDDQITGLAAALDRIPEPQSADGPETDLHRAWQRLRDERDQLQAKWDALPSAGADTRVAGSVPSRAQRVRTIRDEVRHILHRCEQLEQQRNEWGSIWPGKHARYQPLPSEKWNAYGPSLDLPASDHDAIQGAYELANDFNHSMIAGPMTFGDPEPDLDGLRQAFRETEAIINRVITEPSAVSAQHHDPYVRAHELENRHAQKALRVAMRTVGDVELHNLVRPRLLALINGDTTRMALATAQWSKHEQRITEDGSARAFQAGTAAYRSVVDLHADLDLEHRETHLTATEVARARETLRLVDDAVSALRADAP